ncbi:hypothetical protein DSO57_1010470 [Entomophthora muscae]|uniref:Uncharacterized protein n=1 Tax=Entomophthora muscae TaxID=34485 RepID=A0ACC2TTN9_9FUNG|nr:hypothetical protein DSO57_1010470 [Entomophthora muscae]
MNKNNCASLFIKAFATKFPHLVRNGIHIFAQSYDATAATIVANLILRIPPRRNKPSIKILSVGLGSPIVDMRSQMLSYPHIFRRISRKGNIQARIDRLHSKTSPCKGLSPPKKCFVFSQLLARAIHWVYLGKSHRLLNLCGFNYKFLNGQINASKNLFNATSRLHPYFLARSSRLLSDNDFNPNRNRM